MSLIWVFTLDYMTDACFTAASFIVSHFTISLPVSVLSFMFLFFPSQTLELLLLLQILAVLTLTPGAAECSADGFLFSHFGIYQCTLTYLCFHFSPSNSAPIMSKTLKIWQSQPVQGKCKVLRCSGVLCRQPAVRPDVLPVGDLTSARPWSMRSFYLLV